MPQQVTKDLDYYAKNWANCAINTAVFDTLGFISAANCEWLISSGLDWGTLMGAGLLGSIVLYVPTMLLIEFLISQNLLSPLGKDLIYLAYRLSSAVAGAAILNAFFGMAMPLAPVFMCAAIGTAVYYLLNACGCCGAPVPETEIEVEVVTPPHHTSYQQSYPQRQFTTNPARSGNRNNEPVIIEADGVRVQYL